MRLWNAWVIALCVGCNFSPGPVDDETTGDSGVMDGALGVLSCGDSILDGDETCDDGNRDSGDGCEADCTITDDWQCNQASPSDCEPTPVLSLTATTAQEGQIAVVRAVLSTPSQLFPVRFQWFTVDDSAVAPADYDPVSMSDAMIPIGADRIDLAISTTPDALVEPPEVFEVRLVNPVAAQPAGDSSAMVTIIDDEPTLTSEGLIVRYTFSEATLNTTPDSVIDQAGDLDLPVSTDQGEPEYFVGPAGGGLRWTTSNRDGQAATAVDGTVVQSRLNGKSTVTIEAVVDIDEADSDGSYLVGVSGGDRGRLAAYATQSDELCFAYDGNLVRCWAATGVVGTGRHVVTVIFDTAANRPLSLFVDGDDRGESNGDPLGSLTLAIPDGETFVVGNRSDGDHAIDGVLSYVALYDVALAPADVQSNADLLLISDD